MEAPALIRAPFTSTPLIDPGGAPYVAPIVELLLTVGYIDGVFHHREQEFVHRYVDSVMLLIEQSITASGDERTRIRNAWRSHFDAIYAKLNTEIAALTAEVTATANPGYVATRLKVRALEIVRGLDPLARPVALELVHALMCADGVVSPPEQHLYDELLAYFDSIVPPQASRSPSIAPVTSPIVVMAPQWNPLKAIAHPLLDPLERAYSPHPQELQAQVAWDYRLVEQSVNQWNHQRTFGTGLLAGAQDISQFPEGTRFLDGHVYVMRPNRPVELVVLGDLHGCYGCLKAALLQSNFINRVWMHQWDPENYPDVKLVLLGDYIDRGRFSFDGILRAVLQLFVAMPEHVIVLRGNHEHFVWLDSGIRSGVHPAEALSSIVQHVPGEMLEAYRMLFEAMPTSFLFDRTLFVHGGIPRDDTFHDHYRDLSSFNHPELRFQMLWSDPSQTEHIPVELQRQNPRFSFGRAQFRAFMERIGCHTMIRGHEKVDRGFEIVYDLGDRLLLNLFSAGGHDNRDLPEAAPYRSVIPMALTVQHGPTGLQAIPWPIAYEPFNYQTNNGLHRNQPLLEFRYA